MRLIPYTDRCEITRTANGSVGTYKIGSTLRVGEGGVLYDEYDEPICEAVYSGACRYQPQGWDNSSIATRTSRISIPEEVNLLKGDYIRVVLARGGEWSGVVSDSRIVEMPMSGTIVTNIEVIRER